MEGLTSLDRGEQGGASIKTRQRMRYRVASKKGFRLFEVPIRQMAGIYARVSTAFVRMDGAKRADSTALSLPLRTVCAELNWHIAMTVYRIGTSNRLSAF